MSRERARTAAGEVDPAKLEVKQLKEKAQFEAKIAAQEAQLEAELAIQEAENEAGRRKLLLKEDLQFLVEKQKRQNKKTGFVSTTCGRGLKLC